MAQQKEKEPASEDQKKIKQFGQKHEMLQKSWKRRTEKTVIRSLKTLSNLWSIRPACREVEEWVVKHLQQMAAVLSGRREKGALKYIGGFLIT